MKTRAEGAAVRQPQVAWLRLEIGGHHAKHADLHRSRAENPDGSSITADRLGHLHVRDPEYAGDVLPRHRVRHDRRKAAAVTLFGVERAELDEPLEHRTVGASYVHTIGHASDYPA